MKKVLERGKEKIFDVFEVEGQALLNMKRPEVYNRDPCREDLFQTSVSKEGIQFWRKVATWEPMIQMVENTAGGDIACQHLE